MKKKIFGGLLLIALVFTAVSYTRLIGNKLALSSNKQLFSDSVATIYSVFNGTNYYTSQSLPYGSSTTIYWNQPVGGSCLITKNGIIVASSTATTSVFVTDSSNQRVQKFTSEGIYLNKFGSIGSSSGQFQKPLGIDVYPNGDIHVVDSILSEAQRFYNLLYYIGAYGNPGSGTYQFSSSTGIAIDVNKNIYVADTGNSRIQKVASNGTWSQIGSLGSADGQFNKPYAVATDLQGNLYVADTGNNRIEKFDQNGMFLTKWGTYGSSTGKFYSPWGIAVDSANATVYVSDTGNNRIQAFDLTGGYIDTLGLLGSSTGQFNQPAGLTYDSYTKYLYIADLGNNRVQAFKNTGKYGIGTFVTQWGTKGTANGQFNYPFDVATYYSNEGSLATGPISTTTTYSITCGSSTPETIVLKPTVAPTVTLVKNGSYANQNINANTSNVKIGSYVFSASSTEGIKLTTLTLTFSSTTKLTNLSNLYIKIGTTTTPIVGIPSASNNFTINVPVVANGNITIDVYASVGSATGTINTTLTAGGVGSTSNLPVTATATGQIITILAQSNNLVLTYASSSKESALTATFYNVSVTATSSNLYVYQYQSIKFTNNTDSTKSFQATGLMTPNTTLSTFTDTNSNKFYIIPAGTTAQFTLTGVANPQIMFAGNYTATIPSVLVNIGSPAINGYTYTTINLPLKPTNSVTIIGELSPYINSVTATTSSTGTTTVTITGVRLQNANIISNWPTATKIISISATQIVFTTNGVSGSQNVVVTDPTTGSSNAGYVFVNNPTCSAITETLKAGQYNVPSQFVVGGTTQVVANYNFVSSVGTANIIELGVNEVSSYNNTIGIDSVTINGITVPLVNGNALVSGLNIPVTTTGTIVPVTVKYSVIGIGIPSGNLIGIALYGKFTNSCNSTQYISDSSGNNSYITSNQMKLVSSKPAVTYTGGNKVGVSSGIQKIASVTVSAVGGQISLTKLPLAVSSLNLATAAGSGSVKVYVGATELVGAGMATINSFGTVTNTSPANTAVNLSGGYDIAAGTSVTFDIFDTVNLTNTGDTISTRLGASGLFNWKDSTGVLLDGTQIATYPSTNVTTLSF